MKKGLVITLVVLGVLVFGALGLYGYANSTRTTGIQMEQGIVAQYKVEQAQLSGDLTKIREILQVANLKTAKLDTVLTNALQGRYGDSGFGSGSPTFAAIQEAYPSLDLTQYDRVQTAIEAARDEQKNLQAKRADMVRAYNVWRMDGIIRSMVVGNFFPSATLTIDIGGQSYTKGEALARLERTITTSEGDQTFRTGTMSPMDLSK